ncbi:dihydroorotate dehydrogenase [Fervidicella metallireducens AeB]|uniref:Dihydroorotate dehydrogenase n=1 Tax=Fervidicella metallireducens AeB TaxID=1403537 RepID=A0A017RTH1_9CLOT|nr:septum formation initiator family protein [Fervidicella metallireducens]EYE87906.1 dihydroorotate dehydrogenase [Fervidicella metallireducens AeB]
MKKRKIFWLLVMVFFGVIFIKQQFILNRLKKQYTQCNDQLSKLKVQNQQLQDELKMSQREDYIEKMARRKLNLAKPGEIILKDVNNRN